MLAPPLQQVVEKLEKVCWSEDKTVRTWVMGLVSLAKKEA